MEQVGSHKAPRFDKKTCSAKPVLSYLTFLTHNQSQVFMKNAFEINMNFGDTPIPRS